MGAGPVKTRLPNSGTNMAALPNLGDDMQSSGITDISVTPKARVCAVSGGVQGGGSKKNAVPSPADTGNKKKQVRLRIPATLKVGDAWSRDVTIFVDTGSEVSLVKRGLLPDELLRRAQNPLQLLTASGQIMRGGAREVQAILRMAGTHNIDKKSGG